MSNVISDPGFESGTADWQCSRGASIATVSWEHTTVHAGAGAARLTRTQTPDTGTLNFNQATTRYPAGPGESWSGSAWVYNADTTAHNMNCALVWFNAAGQNTNIQGTQVSVPPQTWTRVTIAPTVLPAGAVSVILQVNGFGTWDPGEGWILDDVYLTQNATLDVQSMASQIAYGWWRWVIRTDPPLPEGTTWSLEIKPGATPVTGTLPDAGGAVYQARYTDLAGTYTSTLTMPGAGIDTDTFTVEQLAFTTFDVTGTLLNFSANWAFDQGAPGGTGDAEVDWGDSSPKEILEHADPATGRVQASHQYPLLAETTNYTVTLRSGPQTITQQVTIAGGTRSAVTTEDGSFRAVIDIQEWPSFEYERSHAVLPIQGRAEPVVLLDVMRLPSSRIVFLTRTTDEDLALAAVLKYQGKIHIESTCPGVQNGWFVVRAFRRNRLTNRGTERRYLWPTDLQEVTAP